MKQKGGGGHETEGADEGDVDHLVETCTLHQGSGLLEFKDHLVHLDNLHGLRAFACLVDEDDVDKAEIFSSTQNMVQAVFFYFFILFSGLLLHVESFAAA